MGSSHAQTRRSQHQNRRPRSAARSDIGLQILIFTLVFGVLTTPSWAAQCHSAMSGSYEFAALGRGVDAHGQRNSTEVEFTGVMSFEPGGTVKRLFSIKSGGTIQGVSATDPG